MFFSSSRIILGHLSRQQARTGLLCQVTCVFHMSALPGPGSNVTIHSNGKWPRFTQHFGETKGPNKRHAQTLPSDSLSAKQVKICQEYVKNTSFFHMCFESGWPGTNLWDFHVHIDVGDGNPLFLFFFFGENVLQPNATYLPLFVFSLSLSLSLKIVLCTP